MDHNFENEEEERLGDESFDAAFNTHEPWPNTPEPAAVSAREWHRIMETGIADVTGQCLGYVIGSSESADIIIEAHNAATASLRRELEASKEEIRKLTFELTILRDDKGVDASWRQQCDENERLESENDSLRAQLAELKGNMGRDIHYCKCGEEIFDDMEECSRCAAPPSSPLQRGSETEDTARLIVKQITAEIDYPSSNVDPELRPAFETLRKWSSGSHETASDSDTIRECRAAAYRMDWDWFKTKFGAGSREDFEWDDARQSNTPEQPPAVDTSAQDAEDYQCDLQKCEAALAERDRQIQRLTKDRDEWLASFSRLADASIKLQQDLAKREAAIAVKDKALRRWQGWTHITPISGYPKDCREAGEAALAIQPSTAALESWHAERVKGLVDALNDALDLITEEYPRQNLAQGYWPTIKPIVDKIDAALQPYSAAQKPE